MNIKLGKAYKLSRRTQFRGLDVSIETDKGELRHWYDPHNKTKGSTKMSHPYGYIRRTKGVDGDHVDVYIGPKEDAPNVYVVHQMKAPDFKKYDEDKCMVGFESAAAAKAAYLKNFDDSRFFGSMTTMPWDEFEKKVKATFERPKKIAMDTTFYGQGVQHALEKLGFNMRQALQASFKVKPTWWRSGERQMRSIVNKMDDTGRAQLQNLIREGGGHELLQQRPEAVAGLRKALTGRATDVEKLRTIERPDWGRVAAGMGGGSMLGAYSGALGGAADSDIGVLKGMGIGALTGGALGGVLGGGAGAAKRSLQRGLIQRRLNV